MQVSLGFLPRDLRKALMPFQKDGIRYGIEKEGRCLVGDEMGLGKTLQALSIAYYFKKEWPLLIIVPSSMKYPWIDEIEKWLPEIPPEDINLVKSCSDLSALSKAKINILSYGLISLRNRLNSLLIDTVKNANFGVAIVDESHYVKNRQTSRAQKVMQLLKQMKRVILLTGTPSLARPEELFCQINIISPGIVGDWHHFGERYCDGRYILQTIRGGKVVRKYDTRGASNLKELHEILKNNLMIRRLKKDVLTELPAKRRQRIRFDIVTDSERKKNLEASLNSFKKVVSKFKVQLNEVKDEKLVTMSDVNRAITLLFRDTGLAKAGAIQEYISDLLDAMPNKFVVFCYHLAVIDAVTEILAKRNTRYIRIAGDVTPEIRANYVREFQTNVNCRVAVLSINAACMGITLTAADHVVFAELHWTPGVIKQAEDRCHRIGQKNAVQIHFLTAKGTMDDLMWSMLSRKLTVTSETLDGEAQLLTADEADQGKSDLLSLCQAWIPDEDDDDAVLFTQKSRNEDSHNQKDIRACFAQSGGKKKRKTRKYYEKGFINISDSSDDCSEFKAQHKRSKKPKILPEKTKSGASDEDMHKILVAEEDLEDKTIFSNFVDTSKSKTNSTISTQDSCELRRSSFVPKLETYSNELRGAKQQLYDENSASSKKDNLQDKTQKNLCRDVSDQNLKPTMSDKSSVTFASELLRNDSSTTTKGKLDVSACPKDMTNDKGFDTVTEVERSSTIDLVANMTFSSVESCKSDNSNASLNETRLADHIKTELSSSSFGSSLVSDVDGRSGNVVAKITENPTSSANCDVTEVATNDSSYDTDANRSWSCLACTFDNHGDLSVCEICETARPKSRVTTRSRVAKGGESLSRVKKENGSKKMRKKSNLNDNESSNGKGFQNTNNHGLQEGKSSMISTCIEMEKKQIKATNSVKSHGPTTVPTGDRASDVAMTYKDSRGPLDVCTSNGSETSKAEECNPRFSEKEVDEEMVHANGKLSEHQTPEVVHLKDSTTKYDENGLACTIDNEDGDSQVSTRTDSSSDIECDWLDSELKSKFDSRLHFDMKRKSSYQNGKSDNHFIKCLETDGPRCTKDNTMDKSCNSFCEPSTASPVLFNSTEESTDDEAVHERHGFKTALQLFNEEQEDTTGMDGSYGVNDSCLLAMSEGITDVQLGRKHTLSEDDSMTGSDIEQESSRRGSSDKRNSETKLLYRNGIYDVTKHDFRTDGPMVKDDVDFLLADEFDDDISLVASEKSESEADEEDVTAVELLFKMSFESDRVYLYNEKEEPLGINLRLPQLGFLSLADLPKIFSHPFNLKQLKKFAREWGTLTATKQRMVRKAGLIFKSPLEVYHGLRVNRYENPSSERFTSKEKRNENVRTIADMIGGTVMKIEDKKHERYAKLQKKDQSASSANERTSAANSTENESQSLLQAVDSEGNPLCLFCKGKVNTGLKAGSVPARFCSYNCEEEYLFRTSRSRMVRERLFTMEQGVCQICKFNTHELFTRVAALRKKDRKTAIAETHFVNLPPAILNKIIVNPKEGQFWEADHIKAVSEGGGECGLDNYRTLCIPCHREVTKELHKRLTKKRKQSKARPDGSANIGFYFSASKHISSSQKDAYVENCIIFPFSTTARHSSQNSNATLTATDAEIDSKRKQENSPSKGHHKNDLILVGKTSGYYSNTGEEIEAKMQTTDRRLLVELNTKSNQKPVDTRIKNGSAQNVKQNICTTSAVSNKIMEFEVSADGCTGKLMSSDRYARKIDVEHRQVQKEDASAVAMTEGLKNSLQAQSGMCAKQAKQCENASHMKSNTERNGQQDKIKLPRSARTQTDRTRVIPTTKVSQPSDNDACKQKMAKKRAAPRKNLTESATPTRRLKGNKLSRSGIEITSDDIRKSDEVIASLIAKSARSRKQSKK